MIPLEKILRDGKLHVFILGSGGPFNNDKRVASGFAVIAGGEFILIDVGPGSYRNADILRLPTTSMSVILLTHFHSDHIGDLGEANMLSWAGGREKALEVYGPPGVEQVVNGFIMAYKLDTGYRIAHHGTDILVPEAGTPISKTIVIKDPNERELIFDRNGLRAYAFEVDHSPVSPAVGYRIEYGGRVIVFTGDTIKTDNLIKHCTNADILFCESISFEMLQNLHEAAKKFKMPRRAKIVKDIQDYHMSPTIAAEVAKEANVKKLVYVHVTPPLLNEVVEKAYLEGVNDIFDGEIVLGEDRMKFRLNPDKD